MPNGLQKIYYFFLIALLILSFQNCGKSGSQTESSSQTPQSYDLSSFCGPNGYDKILVTYLRPKCGGCHGDTGFVSPRFAGYDLLRSYYEAKTIPKEKFKETITNNGFCGDSCNLKETDVLYQQIVHWVENPECL